MLLARAIRKPAVILTTLLALAATPLCAQQAKPLKKVRVAVGTSVLNVGYPMLTLPITLGYWKAEGYDVELMPVGATLHSRDEAPNATMPTRVMHRWPMMSASRPPSRKNAAVAIR